MTRWTYLATGEVQSITTADGSADATTLTFIYDTARRLTDISDGLGNEIHFKLDTEGNVEEEVTCAPSASPCDSASPAMTKLLTQTFDAYNRLDTSKSGSDPLNPLESVDPLFDPDGTLESSTDGETTVTDYSYDALKRLLTSTQDLGGTDPTTQNALTQYDYDVADRLTSVIDPTNGNTTYQYDDLGNLFSTTSPDTGTTTYLYDAAGNVTSKTTASGTGEAITLTYTYDALNRLTGVTTSDPLEDITYTYDNCTNGVGRLCAVSNGNANTTYQYDPFGNVTAHQGVSYTYDLANRVKTATYLSGAMLTYHYDAAGQVSGVVLTVNGQSQPLAFSIGYAPFGGIETLTYGNGQGLTQVWDSAYRLTSQQTTNNGIVAFSYPLYDANGNLTQRDDSSSGASVLQ